VSLLSFLAGGLVPGGYQMVQTPNANYFDTKPAARAYNAPGRILPASMRHGLAVTFQAR